MYSIEEFFVICINNIHRVKISMDYDIYFLYKFYKILHKNLGAMQLMKGFQTSLDLCL